MVAEPAVIPALDHSLNHGLAGNIFFYVVPIGSSKDVEYSLFLLYLNTNKATITGLSDSGFDASVSCQY